MTMTDPDLDREPPVPDLEFAFIVLSSSSRGRGDSFTPDSPSLSSGIACNSNSLRDGFARRPEDPDPSLGLYEAFRDDISEFCLGRVCEVDEFGVSGSETGSSMKYPEIDTPGVIGPPLLVTVPGTVKLEAVVAVVDTEPERLRLLRPLSSMRPSNRAVDAICAFGLDV